MNRFALQCLRTIAVFALIGIICGLVWGAGMGLMVFLGLLSLWLFAHLWQIGQHLCHAISTSAANAI